MQLSNMTNANVYLNGSNMVGKASEVELPDVKFGTIEKNSLGGVGSIKLPNGKIEELVAKIKWECFYSDVAKMALNPYQSADIKIFSQKEIWDTAGRVQEVPYKAFLTVIPQGLKLPSFKAGEKVDSETSLTCTYLKVVEDGADILEIDLLNNIYKVNGVDLRANLRANLGI